MPNYRVKDLSNETFLKFIEEFTREAKVRNIEFPELAALRAEREKTKALIEKWRTAAKEIYAPPYDYGSQATVDTLDICADELEAALKGDV